MMTSPAVNHNLLEICRQIQYGQFLEVFCHGPPMMFLVLDDLATSLLI